MYLLALETAQQGCSVAIWSNHQCISFEHNQDPRAQTQQILPMIVTVMAAHNLKWSDLDAIAFSRGPGAFSGVRIGATVTQALAWVHHLPVIPVSSLQALAQRAYQTTGIQQVSAVLDARMNEVYCADYQLKDGIMQLQGQEQLLDYQTAEKTLCFPKVGEAAALLGQPNHDGIADARDIAVLGAYDYAQGRSVSAAQALPVYLRDNVWKKIDQQGKP